MGRYRFDRADQASELTVYSGQAVFEGRNSALPVAAGQHAQFWLDASGAAQYNMVAPTRIRSRLGTTSATALPTGPWRRVSCRPR